MSEDETAQQRRYRLARNAANNLRRRVAVKRQHCEACRKWFTSKRSDAKTCSHACRQALWRARQEEE